jgi:DNA-directed RNA polymerase subunit omega
MSHSFVPEALAKVGNPEILVNMVSKRVRQLGQGFRPLLHVEPRWTFMDIALKEIADGKLTYESIVMEEDEEAEDAVLDSPPKPRKRK